MTPYGSENPLMDLQWFMATLLFLLGETFLKVVCYKLQKTPHLRTSASLSEILCFLITSHKTKHALGFHR